MMIFRMISSFDKSVNDNRFSWLLRWWWRYRFQDLVFLFLSIERKRWSIDDSLSRRWVFVFDSSSSLRRSSIFSLSLSVSLSLSLSLRLFRLSRAIWPALKIDLSEQRSDRRTHDGRSPSWSCSRFSSKWHRRLSEWWANVVFLIVHSFHLQSSTALQSSSLTKS